MFYPDGEHPHDGACCVNFIGFDGSVIIISGNVENLTKFDNFLLISQH